MARLIFARALSQDDGDDLAPIDRLYAQHFGLEPIATRSSLNFYTRTGHAFVAVKEGEIAGFAFAQSIWNGTRPTVYLNRLAVADLDDTESRLALIEAVTKSAYDAAVYDLQVQLPKGDKSGISALADKGYSEVDVVSFARVLGSRGQQVSSGHESPQ